MTKIIDLDLVIGNSFISLGKEEMSKSEIKQFLIIFECLLPKNYNVVQKENAFEEFCDKYNFLITKNEGKIMIKCSIDLLIKFFRLGLSPKIIEAFDNTAVKLKELKICELNKNNKEKVFTKK